MLEPAILAKTAREKLALALNALQGGDDIPTELLDIADPIADAMGVLHRIERSGGAELEGRESVLGAVRKALDLLQAIDSDHPALEVVMEQVAGSLSSVHQLNRAQPSRPGTAPAAPQPAAAPKPVAAQPAAARPVASAPPARAATPPVAAIQPTAPLPPVQPQPQPLPPVQPSSNAAPQSVGVQPVALKPVQPVAPAQPAVASAQAAFRGTQPMQVPTPPQPAAPPQPALQPQAVAPAASVQAAQAQAAHAQAAHTGPTTQRIPAAGATPAPQPVAAPASPQQSIPAASPSREGNVVVELGTHSVSNFYKGLSGNDVIEHGGIFVGTYKIPPIGARVHLRVLLPGDLEFQAEGVVQWLREPLSSEEHAEPGFGARLTQIGPEGRQLVYRYTRNREPMFYDDL